MRTPFSSLQFQTRLQRVNPGGPFWVLRVSRYGTRSPNGVLVRVAQRGSVSLAAGRCNRSQSSRKMLDASFWETVESVQNEIAELEDEKQQALAKVAKYSKRKERLLHSISGLYQQAARDVKEGNESEARKRLVEKAAVFKAMNSSQARSEANAKLASKLEQVIGEKQQKLLHEIIQAGAFLDEEE